MPTLTIRHLWKARGFKPNPNQEKAILHTDGPLYLPAGPGSGKTRYFIASLEPNPKLASRAVRQRWGIGNE